MREPAYGRIVGLAAAAGLLAWLAVYAYLRFYPPPGRGPAYDQVFKYCTDAYQTLASGKDADLRRDPLYARIAAMPPGDYPTGKGAGHIYLFGQEMFEVELPPELRVVRPLPGIGSWSGSDQPRLVIGCTTTALVRVLQSYGLQPDEPEKRSLPVSGQP